MPAQLAWHVQNIVAIFTLDLDDNKNKCYIEFKLWWRTCSWNWLAWQVQNIIEIFTLLLDDKQKNKSYISDSNYDGEPVHKIGS